MAVNDIGNPWLKIWTEPRKTIRSIVGTDPKFGFILLCIIYGLPLALNLAQNMDLSTALPMWAIIIAALVVCPFLGMIGISISSWLIQVTGRWIGGKANFLSVRAVVAWSNAPNIVSILVWCVLIGMFGMQIFNKSFSEGHFVGVQAGTLFLVMLVETIVSIWGFVILLVGLSEVQGFSVWRAFANVIIPFVAVVAILWILGAVLSGVGAVK